MDSIFDDLDKKVIAPQNFPLAIFFCGLNILLSYVFLLVPTKSSLPYYLLSSLHTFLGVCILFFFVAYLRNFRHGRALRWMQMHLGATMLMLCFFVVDTILVITTHFVNTHRTLSAMSLVLLLCMLADLYFIIMAGIALRKILNDFVGLLYLLGNVLTWVIPACFGLIFVLYSGYVKKLLGDYMWTARVFVDTVSVMPTVIIMVIFYRAMKYRQQGSIDS